MAVGTEWDNINLLFVGGDVQYSPDNTASPRIPHRGVVT